MDGRVCGCTCKLGRSNRDVRYEKIPVSVYRKKYTGNTGIPVFWPCKKLSLIGFSES